MDKELVKLTNLLCDYLDDNFGITFGGLSDSFFCYPEESEVYIALTHSYKQDQYFIKAAYQCGLRYDVDILVLGLYHEIGHCMTYDSFTYSQKKANLRARKRVDNGKLCKKKYKLYPYLKDEIAATQWAVDYINDNAEEVKALYYEMQKILLSFYENNSLIGGP